MKKEESEEFQGKAGEPPVPPQPEQHQESHEKHESQETQDAVRDSVAMDVEQNQQAQLLQRKDGVAAVLPEQSEQVEEQKQGQDEIGCIIGSNPASPPAQPALPAPLQPLLASPSTASAASTAREALAAAAAPAEAAAQAAGEAPTSIASDVAAFPLNHVPVAREASVMLLMPPPQPLQRECATDSRKSSLLVRGGTQELDNVSFTASERVACPQTRLSPQALQIPEKPTKQQSHGAVGGSGPNSGSQGEPVPTGPAPPGGPSHGTPRAKPGSECVLCAQPRASNRSKYCSVHKRVSDNLTNSEKRLLKQHGLASPEYTAYLEAWKNASESVKNRAILEYLRQYPDGKGKAGLRRGNFDFTEFQHKFIVSATSGDGERDKKLDYEAFIRCMADTRGWDATRSDAKWHQLFRDVKVERDNGGPDGGVRLVIPSSLVAGGFVERKREVGESKEILDHKRLKLDDNMQVDDLKSELFQGFSQTWSSGAATDSMCDMLPRGAATAQVGSSLAGGMDAALTVLTTVGEEMGVLKPKESAASSQQGGKSVDSSLDSSPNGPKTGGPGSSAGDTPVVKTEGKIYDIVSERTAAHSKIRRAMEKEVMDTQDIIDEVYSIQLIAKSKSLSGYVCVLNIKTSRFASETFCVLVCTLESGV